MNGGENGLYVEFYYLLFEGGGDNKKTVGNEEMIEAGRPIHTPGGFKYQA